MIIKILSPVPFETVSVLNFKEQSATVPQAVIVINFSKTEPRTHKEVGNLWKSDYLL